MIAFGRNFDKGKIQHTVSFDHGNVLLQEIVHCNKKILLVSLYGPNEDSPEFFDRVGESINKFIEERPVDHLIIQGDYNLTLNPNVDTRGYQRGNNLRAMRRLHLLMQELDLHDIWRETNPRTQRFTFRQKNPSRLVDDGLPKYKHGRLDFFLVSGGLLPFVTKCCINYGHRTDHSSVSLSIDFLGFKKGRGLWKFNSGLVKDPEFLERINQKIYDTQLEYLCLPYSRRHYENLLPDERQNVQFQIDPVLLLEIILMKCREETVSYAAFRKSERKRRECELIADLESAQEDFNMTNDEESATYIMTLKTELEQLREESLKGAQVRSRGKWAAEGEKPSAYFCSLEARNFSDKYIPCLQSGDSLLTNQDDILKEVAVHYKKLFVKEKEELTMTDFTDFLGEAREEVPTLNEEEKLKLDRPITYEEVTRYVKGKLKNGKSPGSSGFTAEFYKVFWSRLGHLVTNAIIYSLERGLLSTVQRQGIITLLPKPDRDHSTIKGYRPISLLNTFYKICSGVLADRLKKVLPKLIHPDQAGFVEGRYIGDVIRNTLDIMHHASERKIHGMILSADLESAFDKYGHQCIMYALELFNFGSDFRKWIKTLLTENFSNIIMCGNLSETIEVLRSARQGDPIAPYLFILGLELLAIKVRHDPRIKGFRCGEIEQKNSLLADDVTFYLQGSRQDIEHSLRSLFEILQDFEKISGLKTSALKSKAMWIGTAVDSQPICTDLNFTWCTDMKLLGVRFDNKLYNLDVNFEDKIHDIQKVLASWKRRSLTLLGKITVWRTLALSKLTYVSLMTPFLSPERAARIKKVMLDFLWNGGTSKIALRTLEMPISEGGMNLPNIQEYFESLKIGWIRRLENTKSFWKCLLLDEFKDRNISYEWIYCVGNEFAAKVAKKLSNSFWKEVFNALSEWQLRLQRLHSDDSKTPLWYNSDIKRGNKALIPGEYDGWKERGVTSLGDLCDESARTLKFEEFCTQRNIKPSPLNRILFIGITRAVSARKLFIRRDLNITVPENEQPQHTLTSEVIYGKNKGCKIFRTVFIQYNLMAGASSPVKEKWHKRLGNVITDEGWQKIFHLHHKSGLESKFIWFQIRLIQNILGTNKRMHLIWPQEYLSPMCTFCLREEESILHLFVECDYTRVIWNDFEAWIQQKGYDDWKVSRLNSLFGANASDPTDPLNICLLISRFFIWYCRCTKSEPKFQALLQYLRFYLRALKSSYYIQGKASKYHTIWMSFNDWISEND